MPQAERDELLHSYLDGGASAAQLDALGQQLASDRETADELVHWVRLERLLDAHFAQREQDAMLAALPAPFQPPSPVLTSLGPTGGAGALDWRRHPLRFTTVVVLLTVAAWSLFYVYVRGPVTHDPRDADRAELGAPSSDIVAHLGQSADARWNGSARALRSGAPLARNALLELESGWAEVQFRNGARLLMQAPARLRLHGASYGELQQGRALARVPSRARGFVIATPQAQVTDLGTEFGVAVAENEQTHVTVFQGRVVVARPAEKVQSQTLTTGQSLRVAADDWQASTPEPELFAALRSVAAELGQSSAVAFEVQSYPPGVGDEVLGDDGVYQQGLNAGRDAPEVSVAGIRFATAADAAAGPGVTIRTNAAAVGTQAQNQPNDCWQGNLAQLMQTLDGSVPSGRFLVMLDGLTVGQHYRVVFLSGQVLQSGSSRRMRIRCDGFASPLFNACGTGDKSPVYIVEARFVADEEHQQFHLVGEGGSRAILAGVAVFAQDAARAAAQSDSFVPVLGE